MGLGVLKAVGIYFCLYIFYAMTIPKKRKTKRTSNGSGCIEIGQGDKERRIKGKTRGGHIEYMRGSKKKWTRKNRRNKEER